MVEEYTPRFGLFLVLLAVIGIIACFYVPTMSMSIASKIYARTTSPCNLDWMGTSTFKSLLEDLGYKVIVVDEWSELYKLLKKGGLLVFIAPDKPIPYSVSREIFKLVESGTIDLLVADENITSNNLINLFGLNIAGHAVLVRGITPVGDEIVSPFPRVVLYSDIQDVVYTLENYYTLSSPYGDIELKRYYPISSTNGTYVLRLNWISNIDFILPFNTTSIVSGPLRIDYYIISYTRGFIDYNDDGLLDAMELDRYRELVVGVWATVNNSSKVIVLSDSFIFTNQALQGNNSLYKEYVINLIDSINVRNRTIIMFNGLYNLKALSIGIPYHPSIMLYVLAGFLKILDNVLTSLVESNNFFALILSIGFVSMLTILLAHITSYGKYREVTSSIVDEVTVISETVVRRSVIEGKSVNPRKTIQGIWRILNYSTVKLLGYSIEDAATNKNLLTSLSKTIGVDEKKLGKIIQWLYSVYLKSIGKKKLPLILSWKRALRKYVASSEYILEHMGYTLTREAGYRGIESILH